MIPTVERNPFEPVIRHDETPPEPAALKQEIPAEAIVDTGLPIPSHYDFDMMRLMVQDPFRIFVYWQLKDNPFDRLRKIFPKNGTNNFHTVLKLIDETNNISVFFDAAFSREYWFNVFPDRQYRTELGLRSPNYGYVKLLSSQSVSTPRGGPSDRVAEEAEYHVSTDEFLEVLRDSHLVPKRAFTLSDLLPDAEGVPPEARNAVWESLPVSFRRLMRAIADIQVGRDYDKWWERLNREELAVMVREFIDLINRMGDGEVGYMLLLRYLPELLRRAIQDEQERTNELEIDKPIRLYLAEKLHQASSEMSQISPPESRPSSTLPTSPAAPENFGPGLWAPSLKL
ncbi:MAG TPA: DUF4912 domain-containing protein [Blastocatellia bacterium]|nr:DUF4912 domain-containing protein [Blastocatellia bacterium]